MSEELKKKRLVIRVNPPDCAKCVRVIEKELGKVEDAKLVGVDPLSGKIILYVNPDSFSVRKLREILVKSGKTPYMIEER
ncbi:MAG: cation transporter [Thermoproteota archaeon]